jgi:hypothetical protein
MYIIIKIHFLEGYRLNAQRIRVYFSAGKDIFSSPLHPDWLWGPVTPLSNGYPRLFPDFEADHSFLELYLYFPSTSACSGKR